MNTTLWVIVALLAGCAIGAGLVWTFGVRRAGPLSISEMKKENERFREEVNAHFVQTAELINELTDSYKRVFDHLSDGAERLVDNDALRERMPQVGRQEVRLRHIGAPREAGSAAGATVEASAAKPAPSASTGTTTRPAGSDSTEPRSEDAGESKPGPDQPSSGGETGDTDPRKD